jgi:large subunit ribosomal protein L1
MAGKKYNEAKKLITKEIYPLKEAIALLKQTSTTKFDGTCEVHMNLGVDPRQADQNLRTNVSLPHGTGKKVRVVAFVGEEDVKAAKAAGAVEAGTEDLVDKVQKGWTDFDIAVATPDQMKKIAKVAKTLGQKRLMPSPKSGTVTADFEKAIAELNKGKIELRVDKQGNIHSIFGKVSFGEDQLEENLKTITKKIMEIKPASQKGTYIKSLTVTTTMGPGIGINTSDVA